MQTEEVKMILRPKREVSSVIYLPGYPATNTLLKRVCYSRIYTNINILQVPSLKVLKEADVDTSGLPLTALSLH